MHRCTFFNLASHSGILDLTGTQASTCSSAIGAPQGILNTILGTVPEPNKFRLLRTDLNDAEGESVQTTEVDSWHWHSTPGTPDDSDLANLTRLSPISRQAYPDCARKSSPCEVEPVRGKAYSLFFVGCL